jgi:hypothetical protein
MPSSAGTRTYAEYPRPELDQPVSERLTLQERAQLISRSGVFTGGSREGFESAGRYQLIALLREGLCPDSKVVDLGCGSLRGGYWLIHFLDRGGYCGIEPNRQMLGAGIHVILEPGLLEMKAPRFDSNAEFDSSVFGERFDYFIARSIWSHASKEQIRLMLDAFRRDSTERGVFLTSYHRAGRFRHRDYRGSQWIGRSHVSSTPGIVYHDLGWIEAECRDRSLTVRELDVDPHTRQRWLRVARSAA